MRKRWLCALLALALAVTLLPPLPIAVATEQTTDMKVSDQFIEVLKKMEGFYAYPQWDYAQYTVGYGTRCPNDKLDYWTPENPITEQEALDLLHEEMSDYEIPVNKFIQKYGLRLEQHQYDALVSFSYNVGTGWTNDEAGYLNAAVRHGNMGSALIYGLCLWSTAGGNYILQNRRLSEANMYINGEYKSYTEGNSYPSNYKYVFLEGNGGTVKYTIHGYDSLEAGGIVTDFKDIPTGVDADGKWFVYEFAGWFTEPVGGEQVTSLDGSLSNGTILYAQWNVPGGERAPLLRGESVGELQVNVTANVNVRTGPGTFYPVSGSLKANKENPVPITVTEVCTSGSNTWGKFADGWVSLTYTNYSEVLSQLPGAPFPRAATVMRNEIKVRTEPRVADETLVEGMQKNKGDKVTIVEESLIDGMLWGKMDDGNWICMDNKGEEYVLYDADIPVTAVSVSVLKAPDKLQYVQKTEELNIFGSVVVATYSDGSLKARTIAREITSGFDNTTLGEQTVTVRYAGMTATFAVEIVKATVTFLNYDGAVLSTNQYEYGEAVAAPGVPTRPEDEKGTYVFKGWDKEITACTGNATYTAVFELIPVEQEHIPGDMDGNETVNEDDVIYLLRYVVFPDQYPISTTADFNDDNLVNEDDVIYLLRHIVYPEQYPLS